jgi:hypothetical protein
MEVHDFMKIMWPQAYELDCGVGSPLVGYCIRSIIHRSRIVTAPPDVLKEIVTDLN